MTRRVVKGGMRHKMKRGIERGESGEMQRSKAGTALISSWIQQGDPQIGKLCYPVGVEASGLYCARRGGIVRVDDRTI